MNGYCQTSSISSLFYLLSLIFSPTLFWTGGGYNGLCSPAGRRWNVTVVYLDLVFLLNLCVDYLMLLAAGRLAGEVLRRLRIALGAALGALYACAVFLPGMAFLERAPCRIAAGVLMALAAYGSSAHLLRCTLVFFGVSAALGGAILAVTLLGGQGMTMANGVFYSGMDLRILLLSAAICYVGLTLVFGKAARHGLGELRTAEVRLKERKITLTALVDTGNTLTDPVTGRPVLVAEGEKMKALFPPDGGPAPEELRDPAGAITRLSAGQEGKRWRLLPYRAVGVSCGLLLALRTDGVRVGETDYGAILVALSPTPVSDGGGYSALIGA